MLEERVEPRLGAESGIAVTPEPAPATVALAAEALRIEPATHALAEPPIASEPPPAAAPREPFFKPGQLRRWLGMLMLSAAAAGVLYAIAANWDTLGPMLGRALRTGQQWLAKPGSKAILAAGALTAAVIFSTRHRKKKPESGAQSIENSYQMPEENGHFWRWTLVSLTLIGALFAQAAYIFRTEIAVLAPDARPVMEQACAVVGCTVPLPRRSDLVSIESSDLHPVPGKSDQLQLIATVRNRAFYRQDWPHLEVTLTDTRDKPVVRRVFAPAQYLPEDNKSATGFNSNQELQLDLTLQVEGAVAAGYRIYVFYP